MEYKIISGDGHIDLAWLPPDLFVSNAPAKWKDQVPQVVETAEGGRWYAEGKNLAALALGAASGLANRALPQRGRSKHIDRMYDSGFYEGGPHPTTPPLRIKDQETRNLSAFRRLSTAGSAIRANWTTMRLMFPKVRNCDLRSSPRMDCWLPLRLAIASNNIPGISASQSFFFTNSAGVGLTRIESLD